MVASPNQANASHGYRIVTTYIADPARDAVLMRTRSRARAAIGCTCVSIRSPAAPAAAELRTPAGTARYALGNIPVAFNTNTTTNAVNRDYAVPTYMALESSDGGFSDASAGYAGAASDGLTTLDTTHALTPQSLRARRARDAHRRAADESEALGPSVTLALGFGKTQRPPWTSPTAPSVRTSDAPGSTTSGSGCATTPASAARRGGSAPAAVREYYESVNVVKASEDKTFPGAIAAGLASPWGQSVPAGNFAANGEPTYFGSYREVFSRDMYEAFTGLLVAGDVQTARGGDAVPVRPPAAARRLDAAQLADQRQAGARHRRPPARRVLVSDPDGLAVRAGGRYDALPRARDPRRRLRRRPRSVGRVERWEEQSRLLALDDRGRDRRPDGGRRDRRRCTATPPAPGSTRRPRTTSLATSRAGR